MHQLVIIDYNEGIRTVLQLVTAEEGYQSTSFQGNEAALPYLRGLSSAAIVLFDHYPKGHQLLISHLEEEPTLCHKHAYLLMTTNPLTSTTEHRLDTLQIPILYKPFPLDDLLTAIDQAEQHLGVAEG